MPPLPMAAPLADMHEKSRNLVAIGARMDALGWVPGSSGNLSARIDALSIAITRSGVHKGRLTETDIIPVGIDGVPHGPDDRPSAETLLHCQLYQRFPDTGAVLHGHSIASTTLSMAISGDTIALEGYEILKAFPGVTTHATRVDLPVFDNDQDIARLARVIAPNLDRAPIGYVVRGHGVYAWGPDIERCFWRLEALEFLLSCECERRRMR